MCADERDGAPERKAAAEAVVKQCEAEVAAAQQRLRRCKDAMATAKAHAMHTADGHKAEQARLEEQLDQQSSSVEDMLLQLSKSTTERNVAETEASKLQAAVVRAQHSVEAAAHTGGKLKVRLQETGSKLATLTVRKQHLTSQLADLHAATDAELAQLDDAQQRRKQEVRPEFNCVATATHAHFP